MSNTPYDNFLTGFSFYDFAEKNQKKSFFSSIAIPYEQPSFTDYISKLVYLGVDLRNRKFYKLQTISNFDGNEIPKRDITEITEDEFRAYQGYYGVIVFLEESIIPTTVHIVIKGKDNYYKFKRKAVIEISEKGLGIGACRKITESEYKEEIKDLNTQRILKKNIIVNRKEHEGLLTGKYYLVPKYIKFGTKGMTPIHTSSKDETKLKILLEDNTLNYREINQICEFLGTEFYQIGLLAFMKNYPDLFGFVINKNKYYKELYHSGMEDGADMVEEKINFFITTFYFRLITFTDNNIFFKVEDFKDGKLVCSILDAFYGENNYYKFKGRLDEGVRIERVFNMKYRELYNFNVSLSISVERTEDGLFHISFKKNSVGITVTTKDKTNVPIIYDFATESIKIDEKYKAYERQNAVKDMKELLKEVVNKAEFAEEFEAFCKKHFYDNNKRFNYGSFIIQENRENGRETFLLKDYPNVKDNTERDYYIKVMKLSIIRYLSSILNQTHIPENLRKNFIEFKNGEIGETDFAKKKLFSAFDPYLRGKVKEGMVNLQQKRIKYGISFTSGDVSNFSKDGVGFMKDEDE